MKALNIDECRYFLKDSVRLTIDFRDTDQSTGRNPPPIEKPCPPDAQRIDLPPPDQWRTIHDIPLSTESESSVLKAGMDWFGKGFQVQAATVLYRGVCANCSGENA